MLAAVSSTTFYSSLRDPIQRLQRQLNIIEQETASGRRADIGVDLGAGVSSDIALRSQLDATNALIDANKTVIAGLNGSDAALSSLSSAAGAFRQQLIQAQTSPGSPTALEQAAASVLSQLQSLMNTSVGGRFLFGGQNSGVAPLSDYSATPTSAAKSATASAFQAAFGVAQNSTGATAIAGPAMQSFLDNQFAALFDSANWKANWSNASDSPVTNRIDATTTIATSVTANDSGVRQLAQAAVMISDLGLSSLGSDAQKAVTGTALRLVGQSTANITDMQTQIGVATSQTNNAISSLTAQTTYLQTGIDGMETVDPAQLAMQLTAVSTQLQSAYSLTAQISQLSLLKYISTASA
ncbi:MAG: flagellar hook-associated family protein [Hyphomicrobiales bacterium]|nr:flagellar hook-associated family protein [Hyphomicrobiales bacterium]